MKALQGCVEGKHWLRHGSLPVLALTLSRRRLVPDAAGRPQLQEELEGVLQKLRELLYLIKQMPESMAADVSEAVDPPLP